MSVANAEEASTVRECHSVSLSVYDHYCRWTWVNWY